MSVLENYRLTVFRAVAAQRSFRRAAEQLFLTQPAVTQQIKALEEVFGLPLFDRSGRVVTLTAAGSLLLRRANESLVPLEHAAAELAALKGETSGVLRIAASTTIAQYLLPPLLGAFVRLYPRVKVELTSSNTEAVADEIARGGTHVGLVEGPPHHSQLRSEVWLRDELVLVAPAQHDWAMRPAISIAELAAVPQLVRERGSGTREVIETALEAAGIRSRDLHISMELNSTEAILACIESGVAVGFASRSAIPRQLALGTLIIVPVKGLHIRRDLLLLTPAGPEPIGPAAALLELLRAHRADASATPRPKHLRGTGSVR